MAPFQPDPELRQLLSLLADGDLSQQDYEKLSEVLERNPQAQQYYVEYVNLHASLGWEIAQYNAQDASPDQEEKVAALDVLAHIADYERSIPVATPRRDNHIGVQRQRRIRRNLRRGSLAAALLVLVGLLGVILWSSNTKAPSVPVLSPVAVLVESDNTTWLDEHGRMIFFREGQPLPPQTLRLAQGLAKVRFNEGAVVVLDGRQKTTEFSLVAGDAGHLRLGRLTAHVRDDRAKGFTIDLPGNQRIVDVGTEFGLVVDEAGISDVFVFEGRVQAQRLNAQKKVIADVALLEKTNLRMMADGSTVAHEVMLLGEFVSEQSFNTIRQQAKAVLQPTKEQTGKYVVPVQYIIPDEEGKPVPWYRKSYPDSTGRELIDGHIGSGSHQDPSWMGWADGTSVNPPDSGQPHPRLEFEMEGNRKVDGIEIHYAINTYLGIYSPDRLTVTFSSHADFGTTQGSVSSTDFEASQTRTGVYRMVIRFPATDAKHIRLDFFNAHQWTFLSEVRFLAADNNP